MIWWCFCEHAVSNVCCHTGLCNTHWSKWQFWSLHSWECKNKHTDTGDIWPQFKARGSLREGDELNRHRLTDWLILDIGCYWWHTKSLVSVCLICRLQNRHIHNSFHLAFHLLFGSKIWLMFQLLLFSILFMSLCPPPLFSSTGSSHDSNGSRFRLKSSSYSGFLWLIYEDAQKKATPHWTEFKLHTLTQQHNVLSLHMTQWGMHMQKAHSPWTDTQDGRQIQEQMHRYLIRTDGSCYCLLPRRCEDKCLKNVCQNAQTSKDGSVICLSPGNIWSVSFF